jgi:hypothetical protein
MDSQFETLELGVDDPSTLPVDELTNVLGAMDRLYALAVLILRPGYQPRLHDHLLASDTDNGNRGTEDDSNSQVRRFCQLLDVSDRLKLVGSFEGMAERIVLTGHRPAMREIRACLDTLLTGSSTTRPRDLLEEMASRLRGAALLLNLGPWQRGRLLVQLHHALRDLVWASPVLLRDEIRVLAPGEILISEDEERRAA